MIFTIFYLIKVILPLVSECWQSRLFYLVCIVYLLPSSVVLDLNWIQNMRGVSLTSGRVAGAVRLQESETSSCSPSLWCSTQPGAVTHGSRPRPSSPLAITAGHPDWPRLSQVDARGPTRDRREWVGPILIVDRWLADSWAPRITTNMEGSRFRVGRRLS